MCSPACFYPSWIIFFGVVVAVTGNVEGTSVRGTQACTPKFSEISTLYLGTDKQQNNNNYDEFLEIGFSGDACRTVSLRDYRIAVIDARPKTSDIAASALYVNLYHQKIRDDSFFFVIGKQCSSSSLGYNFDLSYSDSVFTSEISGIQRRAISDASKGMGEVLSNEELSHYPVIFVLFKKPSDPKEAKRIADACEEITYTKRERSRYLSRKGDLVILNKYSIVEPIFEHAEDIVIVNRNSTATRNTPFLQKMFTTLSKQGIKPSMVAISVDEISRDLSRGTSISLCNDEEDDEQYRRTHTSMSWKRSSHTPGKANDCRQSALTRFEERTGYSPDSSYYLLQSADRDGEGEVNDRVNHRADEVSGGEEEQRRGVHDTTMAPDDDDIVTEEDHGAVEDTAQEVCTREFCSSGFTHEEFKSLVRKVDFLYTQAVAKEGAHLKDALDSARAAMKTYEESIRTNFIRREYDLILDSGFIESDRVKAELSRLTNTAFQYVRPLFGEQWENGRRKVTIRCEPCYEAHRYDNPENIPPLASAKGIPLQEGIIKKLRDHMRTVRSYHHDSVKAYKDRSDKRVSDYLTSVDTRINDPNAATARLFFLTYMAVKMYLSPFQFPTLCDTAAALGMEIGTKHRTRKSYVAMATMMSNTMEEKLANYLRVNQVPFSLLLDSSTDKKGKKIVLLYIRFPDKVSHHPTTHFLKAIEVKEAETGENVFRLVTDYFRQKRLSRELVWNLIAVATDGASNMVAERGFQGFLNRHVLAARGRMNTEVYGDKPIIWIHCLAHKIELALSDALFEENEQGRRQASPFHRWRVFATKFLNQLRSFFGTTSTTRRRALTEAGIVLNSAPFLQLRKVFDVRWTASEKDAIHNFMRIYKNLWLALEQMSAERSNFDNDAKLRAAGFLYVLKSLKFYRYMVYQLQLLDIVTKLSESAQRTSSTSWQSRNELDTAVEMLLHSAEEPNEHTLTNPLIKEVVCAKALGSGRFSKNAADDERCGAWFWDGWELGGGNREIVRYKLQHEVHQFEFSLSDQITDAELKRVSGEVNRVWETSTEEKVSSELTRFRKRLARYIKDPDYFDVDEEHVRVAIQDLSIVHDFKEAGFTSMNLALRRSYASRVEAALRARIQPAEGSILYDIDAYSPEKMGSNDAESTQARAKVAEFFGFNGPQINNDVQELQHELTKPFPPETRAQLNLARDDLRYYLPVIKKLMTGTAAPLTRRTNLVKLLSKIVAIPTNTAEVERGFSLYSFLKEPRRSSTSTLHMDTYMRIALNGPDSPAPYYFNKFVRAWTDAGHLPADQPGATRGPGEKSQQYRDKEQRYDAIFSSSSFLNQFYLSEAEDDSTVTD